MSKNIIYVINIIKHNKEYNSYCQECGEDICELCKEEHYKHEIIKYDKIGQYTLKKNDDLKSDLDINLKSLKTKTKMIIDRINNVINTIENYFNIIKNINDNFNISNINYNISENFKYNTELMNIENVDNNISKDIVNLANCEYKSFIENIFKLYNGITKNEIDLIYNIQNNEDKINIFGKKFVANNKDICKIIYDNKEYKLKSEFECQNIKNNELKIKLTGINNATFLDCMFTECSSLSPLSDFSN